MPDMAHTHLYILGQFQARLGLISPFSMQSLREREKIPFFFLSNQYQLSKKKQNQCDVATICFSTLYQLLTHSRQKAGLSDVCVCVHLFWRTLYILGAVGRIRKKLSNPQYKSRRDKEIVSFFVHTCFFLL